MHCPSLGRQFSAGFAVGEGQLGLKRRVPFLGANGEVPAARGAREQGPLQEMNDESLISCRSAGT